MRICASCGGTLAPSGRECPKCGNVLPVIDGFDSYAPELAREGGGFKEQYFADLARMEKGHFWFQARNELIVWALGKYAADFQTFLEIGCGTGYVLSGISREFEGRQLYGSELFVAGLAFAAGRLPSVRFMQMDARRIPYLEEFDAIGAFDVLEHIEDDCQVLAQANGALKRGGLLCVTVPQHPWLWSATDSYAMHVRRYSRRELHEKIRSAGFEIVRSTSFVTVLLPAMILSRLANYGSADNGTGDSEFGLPRLANALFLWAMRADLLAIRMGVDLPAGGSRLVIARKAS